MIGFVGALLGGAAKGYGAGQMEEIKQKREEQLKALDRQFQSQENALTRDVQREQIASSEKQASASLTVQERIAKGQQDTNLKLGELAEGGATARANAQITSQEKIARDQMANAKTLEEMRAASNQLLNTKLTPVTKDGKTSYEMMTPDGKPVPKLKGPDGKEYDWAGPDASTDEAKNYNFMIANGFDPTKAGQLAFGAKNSDLQTLEAGFLKSFIDSSFTSPNESKMAEFRKLAHDAAVGVVKNAGGETPAATPPATAPAAGAPAAATPAVPSSSTGPDAGGGAPASTAEPDYSAIQRPSGMSDEQIIEAVKADPKLSRKSPAMVKKLLIDGYGVKPSAVTAAGL